MRNADRELLFRILKHFSACDSIEQLEFEVLEYMQAEHPEVFSDYQSWVSQNKHTL